jgi:hypothetical protein
MSSTETPSNKATLFIDSSGLTHLNSTRNALRSLSLPYEPARALYNLCRWLQSNHFPAPAAQELLTHLGVITGVVALALQSAEKTGLISPSPKDSPNPTSAETDTAPKEGLGAPSWTELQRLAHVHLEARDQYHLVSTHDLSPSRIERKAAYRVALCSRINVIWAKLQSERNKVLEEQYFNLLAELRSLS